MARGDTLLLEVIDFKDPQHWRWVLKDSSGKFLHSQEVSLDLDDPNYRALLDLQGYIGSHTSPDNRTNDQLRLLDEVGTWIGQNVFGRIIPIILDYTPITVKVLVPPEASSIMYLPLELAHIDNRPLALEDVSLVFQEVNPNIAEKTIGDRLRVLGVFSLPTDISALALRRERYQLMKLIEGIAQNHGVAIDLRVLQYGTTRKTLQEVLAEGDGWDLIHFSGHGARALLVLEKEDGTQDPINSQDLQKLLRRTRHRVKLVTLSSCLSAAATVKETLKWLSVNRPEQTSEACEVDSKEALPSVASALIEDLDCAVLAMRYPVGDEFAIQLAQELYEGILGREQALTSALQTALPKILEEDYNAAIPPLSVATPALFGARAASLVIEAPKAAFEVPETPLASFPNEPKRFVGRVGAIGRANKALAPRSDKAGVLFYGMAGAGKSACALELTYHYSRSRRFRAFVWYKAPKEGDDIATALRNLAVAMENQIPGFKIVHVVDREDDFESWLPHLTETLERSSILVVLDNLESLLTTEGKWWDERWSKLIKAMLAQEGQSRVILTSRRKPIDLDEERLLVESIHALSLDEATLLAREMPNLGDLLLGKSAVGLVRGRELAARTLKLVQGHPKLIELAEDQAGDPEALTKYLDKAAEAWINKGTRLKAFFDSGESSLDAQEFLEMLYSWTQAASAGLPPASRMLFHFLCAIEEPDRQSWIAEQVWPNLWKCLDLLGQAPGIAEALQNLKALVEMQALEGGSRYVIHPGVAEAGLAELEEGFRATVDSAMADFWKALLDEAKSYEMKGMGKYIVLAGVNSAPYLIRLGRWAWASSHLEAAMLRDPSPGTASVILPLLGRIVEAVIGTKEERVTTCLMARALIYAGRWQESETILRSRITEWINQGELRSAFMAKHDLFLILRDSGRFNEALELTEEMRDYACQAGLGPLTYLGIEADRLQALNRLGRCPEVLESIEVLRAQIVSLPEQGMKEKMYHWWNIKETILTAGVEASILSGAYEQALELNAEVSSAMKARGATGLELARSASKDYFPLLRLGHYVQAEELLLGCKKVFESENDIKNLGNVFCSLADLEHQLGRVSQAIKLLDTALRYSYQAGDINDISTNHHNLAICQREVGLDKALSHRLAAGVIRYQIGSGLLTSTIQNLSTDLAKFGAQALPANFGELCQTVDEVDGVNFRELFFDLAGSKVDGDQVMLKIIEMAKGS